MSCTVIAIDVAVAVVVVAAKIDILPNRESPNEPQTFDRHLKTLHRHLKTIDRHLKTIGRHLKTVGRHFADIRQAF
eukprot:257781-Amphidinium_carterae.1